MNKDILLLGNPVKIHHVDYETNEEKISLYIREHGKDIRNYIDECIKTDKYTNSQIKLKFYSFIEEFINLKTFLKHDENNKCQEKNNDSILLQHAFIHLKKIDRNLY